LKIFIKKKEKEEMVLKSIVRFLINKYLKDYIEQLDNEKLKIDFRNG
jgi:hypothetical protein